MWRWCHGVRCPGRGSWGKVTTCLSFHIFANKWELVASHWGFTHQAQGWLLQGMWPRVQGLRAYVLVFLMEVRALTWGQAAGFLPPAVTAARPSRVHSGSCQPVLMT